MGRAPAGVTLKRRRMFSSRSCTVVSPAPINPLPNTPMLSTVAMTWSIAPPFFAPPKTSAKRKKKTSGNR